MADLPGAPARSEDSSDAVSPPRLSEADLLARFFRVLGDPTRLRLLTLLLEQERSVTDLVEAVGAPQGRVSTHLGCLRWCGFVIARREGRQMRYAIADPRVHSLLQIASTMQHDYAAGIASCGVVR
ncbi:MAG TPA: metalloregulator ArsR/SmtB family transcription factor [Ktedonobacterales bacterium]|nr:metalloregulator ArsR/SmtB family transcription factor [Ktedonobacterales bacterium]